MISTSTEMFFVAIPSSVVLGAVLALLYIAVKKTVLAPINVLAFIIKSFRMLGEMKFKEALLIDIPRVKVSKVIYHIYDFLFLVFFGFCYLFFYYFYFDGVIRLIPLLISITVYSLIYSYTNKLFTKVVCKIEKIVFKLFLIPAFLLAKLNCIITDILSKIVFRFSN